MDGSASVNSGCSENTMPFTMTEVQSEDQVLTAAFSGCCIKKLSDLHARFLDFRS